MWADGTFSSVTEDKLDEIQQFVQFPHAAHISSRTTRRVLTLQAVLQTAHVCSQHASRCSPCSSRCSSRFGSTADVSNALRSTVSVADHAPPHRYCNRAPASTLAAHPAHQSPHHLRHRHRRLPHRLPHHHHQTDPHHPERSKYLTALHSASSFSPHFHPSHLHRPHHRHSI